MININKDKKEYEIYVNSETIASMIAKIMSDKHDRFINHNMVYQMIKELVSNDEIIEEVYTETINLLETKYGILFDVERIDI